MSELELFREPSDEEAGQGSGQRPRLLAVSGAKGGVGKTLVATNLAIYLATIGRRVVIVDADSSGANAHGFLGVPHPAGIAPFHPPLPSFVTPAEASAERERDEVRAARAASGGEDTVVDIPAPLEEASAEIALVDVGIQGLRLMHAGLDEPQRGVLRRERRADLLNKLITLDADYVVVDLGTGLSRSLLDLWLDADLRLFVSLPDPTSIEGTFRFARATFVRQIERRLEAQGRLGDLTLLMTGGPYPAPNDLAERLGEHLLASEVRAQMERFEFRFVMNETRARSDLDLGADMVSAAWRRLGVRLSYLGYIDYDDAAWNSLRIGRPLLIESPGTKASRNIEKVARTLLALDAGKRREAPRIQVPAHSHHDLLEVDRGATEEEVRRAYKRFREVYSSGSLAVCGLFDADALKALRARIDEAHDVLLDPSRRRPYELSVFPEGSAPRIEPSPPEPGPAPPAPTILPETQFNGALLRAVRQAQGLTLQDVGGRTKIGLEYLKAIEEDAFDRLPALVYVQGFVREFAKCLELDAQHVSRTYMRAYRRARPEGP